jgi:catechol 2,3-dioxygenase-like lactoylglutathione lyase family enzyme
MRIEHVAFQVADPGAAGEWYCQHLGFTVKRGADAPVPVRFVADESGGVMLELYNNPKVVVPEYAAMDPLLLHVAFVCADVPGETARLVAAGATCVSGPSRLDSGDEIAMLRDPWGLAIQLVKRADPML